MGVCGAQVCMLPGVPTRRPNQWGTSPLYRTKHQHRAREALTPSAQHLQRGGIALVEISQRRPQQTLHLGSVVGPLVQQLPHRCHGGVGGGGLRSGAARV